MTEQSKFFFAMVTTTGSRDYTPFALRSFFKHTELGGEDKFFLIDNDSDFEVDALEVECPLIRICNPAPLGFAENVNQIISRALTENASVVFLNNDLVFPSHWFEPLRSDEPVIASPLSNREVQYAASVHVIKTQSVAKLFVTGMEMKLDDYIGSEAALEAIAEAHRSKAQGVLSVYVLPFFAIRLPFAVLKSVGYFDTSFGAAGGEDYDYCLRARLAGFDVRYILNSWILHFYGKSTWSGVEDPDMRRKREANFMRVFREKWGEDLFELLLHEDLTVIERNRLESRGQSPGTLRGNIVSLLKDRPVKVRL